MSHDGGDSQSMGSWQNGGDPDQNGDVHGNAPNGNEDGDDRNPAPPPSGNCPPPPPPPPGAATVPPDFVSFVNGLPQSFVQGFMAAAPGGMPWTAVEMTDSSSPAPIMTQPTALFTNFGTTPASPLMLTGDNAVGLINDSTAPVTVVDSATPEQWIATGTGGMTLFAQSDSGSFVAEGGNNAVLLGNSTTGGWNLNLLGGNNQIWASGGNDTVQTAAGSTNLVAFGSGNSLANSGGQDIFFGGAGDDTINATGSNVSVVGGAGGMTFIDSNTTPGGQNALIFAGSGAVNVNGGAGSVTVVGGAGGGVIMGGSAGNNVLFAGSGPVTMQGGGSGDLILGGATGGDVLMAGSGNETLLAGAGGNNQITGGSGNDAIVLTGGNNTVVGGSAGSELVWSGSGNTSITGGAANMNIVAGLNANETVQAGTGNDMFTFTNGMAGGSMVINNFNTATDTISLNGYAANSANITTAGGSTMITLSDNTKIQLIGVTNLPNSAIA